MDRAARDTQYVALTTAAAVVLFRLTGKELDGERSSRTKVLLNDVAYAMANIVPITCPTAPRTQRSRSNPPTSWAEGSSGGAEVFRRQDGKELAGLTVRRHDILAAVSFLQSARIGFDV